MYVIVEINGQQFKAEPHSRLLFYLHGLKSGAKVLIIFGLAKPFYAFFVDLVAFFLKVTAFYLKRLGVLKKRRSVFVKVFLRLTNASSNNPHPMC